MYSRIIPTLPYSNEIEIGGALLSKIHQTRRPAAPWSSSMIFEPFNSDEHLGFMDMLQNPTKHKSREERLEERKEKLAQMGIETGDIEEQQIEDSEIQNKPKTTIKPVKTKPVLEKNVPKKQTKETIEQDFDSYGFKVRS